MTHHPRLGDKVWDESRHTSGKQPNGVISRLDWDSKIVCVTWHDSNGAWTEYDMDHISDEYVSEAMGYMLHDYG